MIPLALLKILTPKNIKFVMDYAMKRNNLDEQNDIILEKLENLDKRLAKVEFSENNRETKQDGLISSIRKDIQKLKNDRKK